MAAARAGYILAIDQGTTSTRAMVFDADGNPRAQAQRELEQHYPQPGWVEHDAEEIWQATLDTCRAVLAELKLAPKQVAAIGITNQRETTALWERKTGRPIARAIVWQDRRTAVRCAELAAEGHGEAVAARTGLVIDPYFSATKIAWLLDNTPGARAAAERGELAFGTIDCFLLWRLTKGAVHATDASNAARTLVFDIHRQDWDDALLKLFRVPRALLPQVRDNAADFGGTAAELFGAPIAIAGMAGDQQAATIGQACFAPGMIKSTYGTGCFAVLNTGAEALASQHRLLSTVAYRIEGKPTYAIEGSIFVAGAAVQWLRDGLKLISRADESDALARSADPARRIYVVPAFTGLGAPYWDADARGAIFGLTRDVGRAELVRATLEAACYQTRDLIEAMRADGATPQSLRVDGGMVANDWFAQCLADTLGLTVERPRFIETTVLGAAALAGLGCGLYPSLEALAGRWERDRLFEPKLDVAQRDAAYAGWRDAVARVRSTR
ncbi:MAG TPA: glycerol kinase GlpK [Stellaceae bacterium]|nr:glycerol kinase GlpK [Stellaceae bacterium]